MVACGWLVVGLLGALPGWLSGQIPSFTDAAFESISGFTTTGASILTDIEGRSHATLFWRALTHWLGGMGIVLLAVAILPLLGVGGMQLFRAEVPGPVAERLTPRIRETASLLWGVYVLLTVLEVGALVLAGMGPFDAVCHAFATMATGGFCNHNASVGGYASPAVEWIIIVFMFLAGHQLLPALPGAERASAGLPAGRGVPLLPADHRRRRGRADGGCCCWRASTPDAGEAAAPGAVPGGLHHHHHRLRHRRLPAVAAGRPRRAADADGRRRLRRLHRRRHQGDAGADPAEARQARAAASCCIRAAVFTLWFNERAVSPTLQTNVLGFFLLYMMVYVRRAC